MPDWTRFNALFDGECGWNVDGELMKKPILILALSISAFGQATILGPIMVGAPTAASVCPGVGNPCTDNFNRANGALGSNWTTTTANLSIASNAVTDVAFSGPDRAEWTLSGSTFSNDQYSQYVIS